MQRSTFVSLRYSMTPYRVPSDTLTVSAHGVTHASVHTQAGPKATVAIETTSTRFVAVESCPAWLARALAFHRVTAGQWRKKTNAESSQEM